MNEHEYTTYSELHGVHVGQETGIKVFNNNVFYCEIVYLKIYQKINHISIVFGIQLWPNMLNNHLLACNDWNVRTEF